MYLSPCIFIPLIPLIDRSSNIILSSLLLVLEAAVQASSCDLRLSKAAYVRKLTCSIECASIRDKASPPQSPVWPQNSQDAPLQQQWWMGLREPVSNSSGDHFATDY